MSSNSASLIGDICDHMRQTLSVRIPFNVYIGMENDKKISVNVVYDGKVSFSTIFQQCDQAKYNTDQ